MDGPTQEEEVPSFVLPTKKKEMTHKPEMTCGRGSHNVVATVPQRLQLFSVVAAIVAIVGGCGGGGGGGVLFCLAKDIARVGVCRCVCVVPHSSFMICPYSGVVASTCKSLHLEGFSAHVLQKIKRGPRSLFILDVCD